MAPLETYNTILLFGGSFDPPHVGHVILPTLAKEKTGAEALVYVPCALQPLKQNQTQTPAHHRLAMLQQAVGKMAHTHILTAELDRAAGGQPSYTVDTLKQLRQTLGTSVRLQWLIGADQAAQFDQWKNWQHILELAEIWVMLRPPADQLRLPGCLDAQAWASRTLSLPRLEISSTQIRQRVQQGLPIDGWVAPQVAHYLYEHELYPPHP